MRIFLHSFVADKKNTNHGWQAILVEQHSQQTGVELTENALIKDVHFMTRKFLDKAGQTTGLRLSCEVLNVYNSMYCLILLPYLIFFVHVYSE